MVKLLRVLCLAVALAALSAIPAFAASQPIALEVNQTYYLTTPAKITRIAVANPKIADVTPMGASAINVVAFDIGTTAVTVWLEDGSREDYSVIVTATDAGTAKLIEEAIDLPDVRVSKVGKNILLRGTVENQYEMDLAVRIASLYLNVDSETEAVEQVTSRSLLSDSASVKDEHAHNPLIVNLLEMRNPDQINFEAIVIEVNSNDAKSLGFNWGTASSSDDTTVDMNSSGIFYFGETMADQRSTGSHWYNRNWLFRKFSQVNAQLTALVDDGKARIITRPNVTTMSGKTAGIHLGGTVLYPKSNGNSTTAIEEKDYGIRLNIINPTVDRQGNITARLYTGVSTLDRTNGITVDGYTIPAIRERSAETMVNIPSGMTMAIGGLLNSSEANSIQKIPLLGDIPFLGELFKYHNKTHDDTEIMIFITPRAVNENSTVRMSEEMRDYYRSKTDAYDSMYEVDLNNMQSAPVKRPSEEELAKQKGDGKVHLLGSNGTGEALPGDSYVTKDDEKTRAEKEAEKRAAEAKRIAEEKAKARAEKEERERKRREPQPKQSEEADSILGKYLNQRVLPGVSEEQTEEAMRE